MKGKSFKGNHNRIKIKSVYIEWFNDSDGFLLGKITLYYFLKVNDQSQWHTDNHETWYRTEHSSAETIKRSENSTQKRSVCSYNWQTSIRRT